MARFITTPKTFNKHFDDLLCYYFKEANIHDKNNYTKEDVERNIFTNTFERFEDMRFIDRSSEVQYVECIKHVFKKLTGRDIGWI